MEHQIKWKLTWKLSAMQGLLVVSMSSRNLNEPGTYCVLGIMWGTVGIHSSIVYRFLPATIKITGLLLGI